MCVCVCVCVCACAYGLLDPQVHFARMWDKTTKFKFIIFTVANVQRAIKSWTYIQFANHLIVLRFFFFSPFCCRIFFRLCARKDEQVKQTKKVHIAENSEQKRRRTGMQVIPSIKFLSDSRYCQQFSDGEHRCWIYRYTWGTLRHRVQFGGVAVSNIEGKYTEHWEIFYSETFR